MISSTRLVGKVHDTYCAACVIFPTSALTIASSTHPGVSREPNT